MDSAKRRGAFELRNARFEDHAAIRCLLSEDDLPAQDLSDKAFKHFVVCMVNDAVVGAVGLERYGSSALVRSLVVSDRYRSLGIAAKLLLRIEMRAQESGVTRLFALTTTAQRYLEGKGFVVIERSQVPEAIRASAQFSELCPDSARCFVKPIDRYSSKNKGVA
ncbi:MAG: arsenic resistance N-acetyltransferase ArsN2 [Candidatus Bipolaricaulota bacterium]